MRCYYAHCIAIYSTPQEDRDVFTLESMGFEVTNPNSPEINAQCERLREEWKGLYLPGTEILRDKYAQFDDVGHAIMELVFKPLLSAAKTDVVAFRALPDGRIPAGVAKEIEWAQTNGIPVIELPASLSTRTMSVAHTREYLREVGCR